MANNPLDPIKEIRDIRKKYDQRFKTMDEYCDYVKTIPSADVLLAQIRAKIAKTKTGAAVKTKATANVPAGRRKSTVQLAHA